MCESTAGSSPDIRSPASPSSTVGTGPVAAALTTSRLPGSKAHGAGEIEGRVAAHVRDIHVTILTGDESGDKVVTC